MDLLLAMLLAAMTVWVIDRVTFYLKILVPIFRVLTALRGWEHRFKSYYTSPAYEKRGVAPIGWSLLIGPRYREVGEITYDPVDRKITLRGDILTRDGVSSYSLSSKTEYNELLEKLHNTKKEFDHV